MYEYAVKGFHKIINYHVHVSPINKLTSAQTDN